MPYVNPQWILNWHLDEHSSTSSLTLEWQSVNSGLSIDRLRCNKWHSVACLQKSVNSRLRCRSSVNRRVDQISIKVDQRLIEDVDRLSTTDHFGKHDLYGYKSHFPGLPFDLERIPCSQLDLAFLVNRTESNCENQSPLPCCVSHLQRHAQMQKSPLP